MTLYDIHLKNLQELVQEFGTVRIVADLADCSEHHLREVLKGGKLKSGLPKGIGQRLARRLERGTGKPVGWMDELHDPLPPDKEGIHLAADEQLILANYRNAPYEIRRIVQLILALNQNR